MKKTMSTLAFAIAVLLAPAAYAQSAPLTREAFSYDAAKPLGVRVLHQSHEGTLTIQEITFASPNGGDIHAQLVFPQNRTNRGGVLFVHWLGDPKTTNLTEFHRDAISVAQHGSVAMLIDAMWAQPHWFMRIRTTDTDYVRSIQQVVDLRRALDVLLSRPGIVPSSIAYVGHDFGAMYGAVLSGIDDRVRWYVLMAGNTTFCRVVLAREAAGRQSRVRGVNAAARTVAVPCLFQGGRVSFSICRQRRIHHARACSRVCKRGSISARHVHLQNRPQLSGAGGVPGPRLLA
jgi:hypothetical protein